MKKLLIPVLAIGLLISGCQGEEKKDVKETEKPAVEKNVDENKAKEKAEVEKVSESKEKNEEKSVETSEEEQKKIEDEYTALLMNGNPPSEVIAFMNENISKVSVEVANSMVRGTEELIRGFKEEYQNKFFEEGVQDKLVDSYGYLENKKMAEKIKDEETKILVLNTINSGYRFIMEEGMIYPIEDYEFMKVYKKYISDDLGAYIDLMAVEFNNPTYSDAHVAIETSELERRMLSVEKHINTYPEGQNLKKVYELYLEYVNAYTAGTSFMNVEYPDNNLNKEVLEMYKKFVKDNEGTASSEIIANYLKILEENNNQYNENVSTYMNGDVYQFIRSKFNVIF